MKEGMQIVTNKREVGCELGQFDEKSALEALDGERELLCQLATMFVEDAPQLLTELEDALAADDPIAARRATHSLKGLVATFFAASTVELAHRLEQAAADGRLDELAGGGCRDLRIAVESLGQELRARGLA